MKATERKKLYKFGLLLGLLFIASSIGIFVFIAYMYFGAFTPFEASSIAVIGGADGPTTVFIGTRTNPKAYICAAIFIFSLALASLILLHKKY